MAHRRMLVGGIAVLLAGSAITAFGIAPLAPDASDLPKRVLIEQVRPQGVQQQLESLAAHALALSRSELTRHSDTVDSLLKRLGVADPSAAAFLLADPTARELLQGKAGKRVQALARADGSLVELVARYPAERLEQIGTHFTRLSVNRTGGTWQSMLETAPLDGQLRLGSGTIRSTLFAATDEARIPDAVANQLAEIFSTDVDFRRELRRGDRFSVVYEALTADGEPISWGQPTGRVQAAEFVNDGQSHQAFWFAGANGSGAYFGPDGQSKRRAFLTSPLEFSRVTSGFAMRMHPILHTPRAHNGVDFAAPGGTPVRAVGDATVVFAGWQSGYGKVVELRHANDRSTLYAHLSRIDVGAGARVAQGQRLGAVGATGWATGPHLHFEVKVGGEQRNPLQVAQSSQAVTVEPAGRDGFAARVRGARAQLDVAQSLSADALFD
jgi:murein DD-endopeptidase MepM/ murein hydrolase activator NlpD